MHRHNVLFNFKEELSEEERNSVIESMRSLSNLPTAQNFVVEKNIVPPGEKSPFEWFLAGDFADEDARQAYEQDEHHLDVVRNTFIPSVKDFIMSDINY